MGDETKQNQMQTIEEVKAAAEKQTVYWGSFAYKVTKDAGGDFWVCHASGNKVPLKDQKPEEFFK